MGRAGGDDNASRNLKNYERYVADGVYCPRSRRELPASSAGSHACGEDGLESASAKQELNTLQLSGGLGREIKG